MDSHNQTEQISELKALRMHYKRIENDADGDKFDFLGPKVPQSAASNPTQMKITCKRHDICVTVTLPVDYPSQSSPIFKVNDLGNGIIPSGGCEAIQELLDEQASYMPGMICVSICLLA